MPFGNLACPLASVSLAIVYISLGNQTGANCNTVSQIMYLLSVPVHVASGIEADGSALLRGALYSDMFLKAQKATLYFHTTSVSMAFNCTSACDLESRVEQGLHLSASAPRVRPSARCSTCSSSTHYLTPLLGCLSSSRLSAP